MADDDILIKLSFQMTSARAVNAAIAKLKQINAIQTTSVQRTALYTEGVKTAGYELTALGQSSIRNFGNQETAINAATNSIAKYKGTSEAASNVTTQAGDRSVAAMNRQKRGLVGLRLAQHRAQRTSWSFVMMSMSMLGVFFSMMSFTMLLSKGFNALVTPLLDVDSAIGKVADGFIFNEMIGNNLEGTYGSMSALIQDKVIPAWKNVKALTGEFSLAMLVLGATIFSDQELVDGISESIRQFSVAMQDPEIQVAIKSMIIAFADLIPTLADALPAFAKTLEIMAPMIPILSKLAFGAAVLMPVFSVLNAFFMFASKAIGILALVMEQLAIRGITVAIMSNTVTGAVASLGTAIVAITLPAWAWIAVLAAIVAALAFVAHKLGVLDDIVTGITEHWREMQQTMSGGVIGIAGKIGTEAFDRTTGSVINQYVNIGSIAETIDMDRMIDRLVHEGNTSRS